MRDGKEVTEPQQQEPDSRYRVLLLNDDQTPMEFVVDAIERVFGKDHEAAVRLMLCTHQRGIRECGVYAYETAKTKAKEVMDFAREHQHPLRCVMEKI
jgi:ATP-dependent Clp protease adaptor protein ClpS